MVPDREPLTSKTNDPVIPFVKRSSWIPWRDLVSRVFGFDPLVCPRCGSFMRVRAVIRTDQTARKLLEADRKFKSHPGAMRSS